MRQFAKRAVSPPQPMSSAISLFVFQPLKVAASQACARSLASETKTQRFLESLSYSGESHELLIILFVSPVPLPRPLRGEL